MDLTLTMFCHGTRAGLNYLNNSANLIYVLNQLSYFHAVTGARLLRLRLFSIICLCFS